MSRDRRTVAHATNANIYSFIRGYIIMQADIGKLISLIENIIEDVVNFHKIAFLTKGSIH